MAEGLRKRPAVSKEPAPGESQDTDGPAQESDVRPLTQRLRESSKKAHRSVPLSGPISAIDHTVHVLALLVWAPLQVPGGSPCPNVLCEDLVCGRLCSVSNGLIVARLAVICTKARFYARALASFWFVHAAIDAALAKHAAMPGMCSLAKQIATQPLCPQRLRYLRQPY